MFEGYDSLEEYFEANPDVEDEFYDEMARMYEDSVVEYPEDW